MTDTFPGKRASLSQQIRDTLLERILAGQLKPGERLIELKIAGEMKTSQAPVREALRELEAIGVIDTERNKGARVRVIDERELGEIYAVRAELEALAGELAARRAPDIASALERTLGRMENAAARGEARRFAELNWEFHSAIVEAAASRTLADLWDGLSVRGRTRVNMSRSVADLAAIAASHRPIIEAIGAGDTAAARETSWRHVRDNAPVSLT